MQQEQTIQVTETDFLLEIGELKIANRKLMQQVISLKKELEDEKNKINKT